MPPKPTCKVVKREGQRGARIDPKGCKVRTTKDARGNKKKETKHGNEKIKRMTTKRDMRLAVVGSPQRHLIARCVSGRGWGHRDECAAALLTIQKSKYKNIKCCGCECDRDPTLPSASPSEVEEPQPRMGH